MICFHKPNKWDVSVRSSGAVGFVSSFPTTAIKKVTNDTCLFELIVV